VKLNNHYFKRRISPLPRGETTNIGVARMKRANEPTLELTLAHLPEDVLRCITRFFFDERKKRHSLDRRGFARLYHFALVSIDMYRVFSRDLIAMIAMRCGGDECPRGIGQYLCGDTQCDYTIGQKKLCKRCCADKCSYCRSRYCSAHADMEECARCPRRYCNDECVIFGFTESQGGSGYDGELCKYCTRRSSGSVSDEEDEEEDEFSSDPESSSDSGLSSYYDYSEDLFNEEEAVAVDENSLESSSCHCGCCQSTSTEEDDSFTSNSSSSSSS